MYIVTILLLYIITIFCILLYIYIYYSIHVHTIVYIILYIISDYTKLYCTTQRHTMMYYIRLFYSILQHTALDHTTLHYTTSLHLIWSVEWYPATVLYLELCIFHLFVWRLATRSLNFSSLVSIRLNNFYILHSVLHSAFKVSLNINWVSVRLWLLPSHNPIHLTERAREHVIWFDFAWSINPPYSYS